MCHFHFILHSYFFTFIYFFWIFIWFVHLYSILSIFVFFQNISGEKDFDQLSRYFTKQEDENFALFSYVNELSYEVEVLNETVQKIRDDIGEFERVVYWSSNHILKQIESTKQNNNEKVLHQNISPEKWFLLLNKWNYSIK